MATTPYRAMSLPPAPPAPPGRPLREIALGVINSFFLFCILAPALMLSTTGAPLFGPSLLFAAVIGTPPSLAVAGIVLRGKSRRRVLLLPSIAFWAIMGVA